MTKTATAEAQFSVVVPAAGSGKRMGADRPKQYLPLLGKTLLEWTLTRLMAHPQIKRVVLAIAADDAYFYQLAIANAPWLTTVIGGAERAHSVLAGLNSIADEPWVIVHDAARPCVALGDISKLLALSSTGRGGILAAPVRDTIKRSNSEHPTRVAHSVAREHLWHALTPQFFPTEQLRQALAATLAANLTITDEASAIEHSGGAVTLVEGLSSNIKVTQPEDLALAAFYLQCVEERQTHA